MARLIVACPACKARFDVSNFRPGSKIRCGSCYKILRIPDRVGGETSLAPPRSVAASPSRAPARPKQVPPKPAPPRPSAPEEAPSKPKRREAAPEPKPAPKPKKPPAEPAAAEVEKEAAPEGDLIGKKAGGEFEIVRPIGEGGYGSVYEATDLTLKRRVAIKLMLRERTSNEEFVEKFLREARTAAQLSHPNIVKIHLVGFDRDLKQHFLAMEFVEGETLGDLLAKEGPFSLEKAVDVIVQAANGLGEAHRKNIIHRDIKPGNIMITPKGVVKIADFGLAKIYDPSGEASTIIGTPYFMPPEQFEGKAKDGRTDIYSLGVTFYYLLTRRRPFDGTTPAQVLLNIMKQEPPPPGKYNPDVPDGIGAIIRKMMARDVADRYATCEELLRDLKGYSEATAAGESIFCPSCGFGNPLTADKCVECRTSLLEPCPSCGTPDTVGAKFCGNCGANLAQEKEIHALLAEAESHVAAGRLDHAIEKYRQARKSAPDNSGVIEGLRRAEQSIQERDEAVADVKRLLDADQPLKALRRAEEATEKWPTHDPLSELHAKAKDLAKDALLASELREARELISSGQLLDACAAARRALDIDHSSDEATALLKQAEDAMEGHGAARDRAESLEAKRRLTEALAAWREALEILPNDDGARQAVSRLEEILGQVAKHRTRAEEALANRDLKTARLAVEDAVSILADDEEVVGVLDRLRVEERKLEGGVSRAVEELAAGNAPKAIEVLDALMEVFPEDESVRSLRDQIGGLVKAAERLATSGRVWLGRHRPETAAVFARAAQRIATGDGDVEKLLVDAKEEKKRQMAALAEARALLEKEDFAAAAEQLADLGGPASAVSEVADLARRAAVGIAEAAREAEIAEEAESAETPEPKATDE